MDRLKAEELRALVDANELDEALGLANRELNESPEDPYALFAAAQCLMRAGRKGLAFNLFARVLEIEGERPEILNAMGFCLDGENQIDAAKALFEKCVKLNERYPLALNNLCSMHVFTGEPLKALYWGDKALKAKPGWYDPEYNMGLAHLMMGNWRQGWAGYERGLGKATARGLRRHFTEDLGPPDWEGEKGKTVIITAEQGIGDEIMFASVLPDAIRDCRRVILECDKRLEGLFRRAFPEATIYPTRFQKEIDWPLKETFDAKCAIGSLGRFYRNRDEDFPGTPHLRADPERVTQWKALLGTLPGRKKVGIAWSGGIAETFTRRRSVRLSDFLPILRTQGVDFVSLQYKDPSGEIEALKAAHGITVHHWKRATETDDYDDTAALVASCDLVISVCTSVIHLAGALGKAAWVLVPKRPMWRYGLTKETMPFYGCHTLLRQEKDGEWRPVIENAAARLRNLVEC